MSKQSHTVFLKDSKITQSLLCSLIEHKVEFIFLENGTLYEIISQKEIKKISTPVGFTFKDALTGKIYKFGVNKCSKEKKGKLHINTTTDDCEEDILFTVTVYSGSPSDDGTIISGPINMIKGDALNFCSIGGILNITVEGSVDLQTEVRDQKIAPRPPNPAIDFVGWESDAIYYDSLNK